MTNGPGGFPPELPTASLPPADWYPDPNGSGQLRYWNGASWTEHFAPRPVGLRSVGDWLSQTFSKAWERVVPLLALLGTFSAPAAVVFGLLAAWLAWPLRLTGLDRIGEGDIDSVGEFFDRLGLEGFSFGRVLGLVAIVLAWLLVQWALVNAMRHQLYWAHRGAPPTWSQSARIGAKKVPRLVLWALPALVFALVVMGALTAAFAVGIAAGGAVVAVLLVAVVTVALIPVVIFLAVRLWFFTTAVVVTSAGVNPWAASFRATSGQFWSLFGRALLWWLIATIIGYGLNALQVQVTSLGLLGELDDFGLVEPATGNTDFQVTRNGVAIDSFGVSDLFSGRAALAVGLIITGLANSLVSWVGQSLTASSDANLYIDLGGAADEPATV